jgi:hypothetical protein
MLSLFSADILGANGQRIKHKNNNHQNFAWIVLIVREANFLILKSLLPPTTHTCHTLTKQMDELLPIFFTFGFINKHSTKALAEFPMVSNPRLWENKPIRRVKSTKDKTAPNLKYTKHTSKTKDKQKVI